MAQYVNLKDYFQNEHIKLIKDAVSNHLKDDSQIIEAVIRSLVCTADDAKYNTEFDLGVSVKTVEVEGSVTLSFIVTVRGNLEQRFKDIQVIAVRKINSDMFPDDNILSQFILPDIPKDKIEDIGNDLYGFCAKNGLFVNYKLYIEKLVSDGMIHFAPLPNNCLGRVILSESDVEIIQNVQTECGLKPIVYTIHATHGTILLNYKKYAEEMDGGLRITVAHELVHTLFHDRFLKLLQLLGEEKVDMLSSADTDAFTDIQQALSIAEWQADILAMRLAIPSDTADTAMNDIAKNPSTHYENHGDRMQACVIKFAKLYGVSPYVAKERLRQLGYDNVDGTIIEFDGDKKKPFTFPRGTLNENETFVINRVNYERLLRENKDFAELINSGRYVYLGYVVCLFDNKYINIEENGESIEPILSEYARENALKCLLKFQCKMRFVSKQPYYYNVLYLNKIPDYNETAYDEFKLSEEDTDLDPNTISDIKKYNEILTELHSSKPKESLANTVIYYMKRKSIHDNELYKKAGLSLTALRKIYQGGTERPKMRTIMGLCIGLELDNEECYDMFEKAGYNVREDTMRNRAYRYLFGCTESGLNVCNKILRYFNQKEFPIRK